jgi:hypothetical protein
MCKLLYIRQITTARIAQCRHLINIYTQSGHNRCKGTKKNAHLQANEQKVYFLAKFDCKWAA